MPDTLSDLTVKVRSACCIIQARKAEEQWIDALPVDRLPLYINNAWPTKWGIQHYRARLAGDLP